ncbi:MAG: hypothetical protein OXI87_23080 [Albidovulum sp.]|nr:hypothetical protein [Albidovulum sp.]MDE0307742.1 hypothetical protein [Albidovulum sp.]MDE0532084.1 hypothetical protein [Albidovulum sp.]
MQDNTSHWQIVYPLRPGKSAIARKLAGQAVAAKKMIRWANGSVECPVEFVKERCRHYREILKAGRRGLPQPLACKRTEFARANHAGPSTVRSIMASGIGETARRGALNSVAFATREIGAMIA